MKKYFLCLLLAIAIASAIYVAVNHHDTAVQIDNRDDNGTIINGQNPIDEPTKVVPPSTINGGEQFLSEPQWHRDAPLNVVKGTKEDDRPVVKDLTKGIQSYTDENGVKHGITNDDPGPGSNTNNGVGSYVEPTSARAELADVATI
ncbi:hypothetical protein IJJ39_02395 [Candidatus Saccharibacteria bacterium]|nr:hypothetical protein [Candidatus Saccharibacteria bacterium]